MYNIGIGDIVIVKNLHSAYFGRKFEVSRIEWPPMCAEGNQFVEPALIHVYDNYCGRRLELVFKSNEVEKDASMWPKTNPFLSTDGYPSIKKVIFNPPATIILWSDGTKTVVKANGIDIFDPEKGLAMAISKKALGNKGNYYNVFKRYIQAEPIDFDFKFDPNKTLSEEIKRCAEALKIAWGIK